jgi:hypothetical protein
MPKPSNPGMLRALFSGGAQNGLRLGSDRPLFDRKLLEELYELGVRTRTIPKRNRQWERVPGPDVNRAQSGRIFPKRRSHFQVQGEVVSTPVKIRFQKGYFSKIPRLIAI